MDGVTAEAIGARIKKAREDAGFDVAAQFADKVGIRPHALWRYENGRVRPAIQILVRIAEVTNVDLFELATGRKQNVDLEAA